MKVNRRATWLFFSAFCVVTSIARAERLDLDEKIAHLSEHSSTPTSLYIQCQLRYAMDCEVLRRFYFEKFKQLKRQDDDSAMIKVVLTDELDNNGILVHSRWSSTKPLSVVPFPLPDLLLLRQYDTAKIQAELMTHLSQGVLAHIRTRSGTGLDEVLIASLNTEEAAEASASSPFFVDIGLNGSASKSGMGSKNPDGSPGPATSDTYGGATVTLNHSTKRTRIFLNANANYYSSSQPDSSGGTLTANNLDRGLVIVGIYSLDKAARWNVAIIGYQNANPGSNLKRGQEAGAGLEYNLVPFRIDQPYEFRVRGVVTQYRDRLVMANDRGNTNESYGQFGMQLYFYWLMLKDKASLNGTLGGSINLNHSGYYATSGSTSFNYQITRSVRIRSSISYGYQGKSMRFPGVPDFSNPLQTSFLSGYSGANFSTSVGVVYTIGKGGPIFFRDRRFMGSSSQD